MKQFTDKDIRQGYGPTISTEDFSKDLAYCPLRWQAMGLQQTASGYGSKLTTRYKISYNGKLYRVYCTQYSNAGSCWFTAKGVKIYVH